MTDTPAPAADRRHSDQAAPGSPTDIPPVGWLNTARRAFAEFRSDDMMVWAAALTYYAVLSVFPALLVMVALLGVVGQYPQTSDAVLEIVGQIGPKSAVDTLQGTIEGVVKSSGGAGALLGIGLLISIWSASGYIGAFFKAANTIYEVQEGRPFWKLRPIQLGLTIFFLLVAAFGAVVFVASGSLARSVGDVIGLGDSAVAVWSLAKWPVLAVAVMALIALLYWVAPNVRQPTFRWISPGGAVGLLALVLASTLFELYVANFGSYNKTYGTLAFVPLFLTWLWISNLALLFGAEFDAEIERQRRIEGGMRPADAEPFLPMRDEPGQSKDGADLAREHVEQAEGGAQTETETETETEPEGEARPEGEPAAAGEPAATRSVRAGGPTTSRHRSGGLLGRLRGR